MESEEPRRNAALFEQWRQNREDDLAAAEDATWD
jgi:hypothetical protein